MLLLVLVLPVLVLVPQLVTVLVTVLLLLLLLVAYSTITPCMFTRLAVLLLLLRDCTMRTLYAHISGDSAATATNATAPILCKHLK